MAKLSDFKTDTRAMNDGAWIRVDEARFGDLEILSRGFTDEFVDAQNARLETAAGAYDDDVARIPNATRREINAGLLRDFLVLDVRNLDDDPTPEERAAAAAEGRPAKGRPVPVAEFHALLADPGCAKLAGAAWKAAGKVSTLAARKAQATEGN